MLSIVPRCHVSGNRPGSDTLIDKIAQLDLPDHVHNWLVDFFDGHSHQTKYEDEMSSIKSISASIIQGSVIRPASYVVNTSDLHAVLVGNDLCKYADDTYLIIPGCSVSVVVGHRTRDREVASSVPGRCIAG